jgi:hypothetical protein
MWYTFPQDLQPQFFNGLTLDPFITLLEMMVSLTVVMFQFQQCGQMFSKAKRSALATSRPVFSCAGSPAIVLVVWLLIFFASMSLTSTLLTFIGYMDFRCGGNFPPLDECLLFTCFRCYRPLPPKGNFPCANVHSTTGWRVYSTPRTIGTTTHAKPRKDRWPQKLPKWFFSDLENDPPSSKNYLA